MLYSKDSHLYAMIRKNEKILWQGKPDKLCSILESIFNPMLPIALFWAILDFTFIKAFMSFGTQILKESSFMPTFFIVFMIAHLLPVWLYLGGVIGSYMAYRHTEYLITDKAIYTSGGIFSITYKQKPFAKLSHVNIHRGIIDQLLGVGDITLASDQDDYNTRKNHSKYKGTTISDIPDYQEVYDLVKKLQEDVNAESNVSK